MPHPSSNSKTDAQRALKILAKSVYRELKSSGYERGEIVAFASEVLDLVTSDMKKESDEPTLSAS